MNRILTATASQQWPPLSHAGRNVAASSCPRVRGSNRGTRTSGARRTDLTGGSALRLDSGRQYGPEGGLSVNAQNDVTGRRDAHNRELRDVLRRKIK